ncbi:uncharacterized protein FIBRA_09267 [Fibroporia radiculosa]|uniref:Uncharacterized protein n=1 Tax=Fibroporia radiculosa TaxID=599839 RepID=J7SCV8_9APHY|nr:uncharacterized protein FIBRA_09267 [Fibroporia radiculosa]CCM06953.1 predicted protein [Fibroporia radiculosa]
MESLNLNTLVNSLPPSNLANAEKELTNNFKAAALSLTTLYRSSRRTSKRAYNAGYAAACQDLLLMIQQGVSTGESSDSNGQGMTIGRIMDYIEARLEAIKSREEEEDEDEEKERPKPTSNVVPVLSAKPGASTLATRNVAIPSTISSKSRSHPALAPPTPETPLSFTSSHSGPSSPSPLSTAPHRPILPLSHSTPLSHQRTSKSRLIALSNAKETSLLGPAPGAPFPFEAPSTAVLPPPASAPSPFSDESPTSGVVDATVGSKRRHNVMLLDSAMTTSSPDGLPPAPGGPSSGTNKRRTRSSRGPALGLSQFDQNQGQPMDAMDIEEEGGRERKRVARR